MTFVWCQIGSMLSEAGDKPGGPAGSFKPPGDQGWCQDAACSVLGLLPLEHALVHTSFSNKSTGLIQCQLWANPRVIVESRTGSSVDISQETRREVGVPDERPSWNRGTKSSGRAHLIPLHTQLLHLPRDAGETLRLRVVRLAEPPLAVDAQLEQLRACVAGSTGAIRPPHPRGMTYIPCARCAARVLSPQRRHHALHAVWQILHRSCLP